MKISIFLLYIFILSHSTFAQSGDPPKSSIPQDFILSKGAAGKIHLEMSVDEVYNRYGRDNTRLVDLFLEGFFTPALEIFLPPPDPKDAALKESKPSLIAEIHCPKPNAFAVYRLQVFDPRFKTREGIGVGNSLGEARKHLKFKTFASSEGGIVCGVVEPLGMTLLLDWNPPDNDFLLDPERVPNMAKIESILIVDSPRDE
ncbi:MAG: hypothetical protein ACE15F_20450 [bacterium]